MPRRVASGDGASCDPGMMRACLAPLAFRFACAR